MEYWGGATSPNAQSSATGGPNHRQRGRGGAAPAHRARRRRLREDIVGLEASAKPVSVRRDPDQPVPYTEAKGAVLLHILEELFQHFGQMEITRDTLVAGHRR